MENKFKVLKYLTQIMVWLNGKPIDQMFRITIDESIDSLKRLKHKIFEHINKSNSDKSKIYNYKGLEIDDNDIQYFKNDESIYFSPDGKYFQIIYRLCIQYTELC
jgi:hypothetical protein